MSLRRGRRRWARLYAVAAGLLLAGCRHQDIYDGFEAGELGAVWRLDKFVPGAIEVQSDRVRAGHGAAKVTLRAGDQIEREKGTMLERAEIQERDISWENVDYEYSFSLFLPADFPVVPTRLVIAQWKQDCAAKCDPDNPVLPIRYEAGELRVTLQTGPSRTVLYSTKDDIRGRWLDFRFAMRFTRTPQGYIKGWLDGRPIIDFTGVTAYAATYGYPEPGEFYFKTGFYRDQAPHSMTLYIDEYRKRRMDGGAR